MTIYKPIKNLTRTAADLAVRMATGKPVIANAAINNGKVEVPTVLLDVFTVTKDNLVDTVVKDGFHSYDEIYGDVPEKSRPPKP